MMKQIPSYRAAILADRSYIKDIEGQLWFVWYVKKMDDGVEDEFAIPLFLWMDMEEAAKKWANDPRNPYHRLGDV